ncbi:MAG: pseudouridine synthase [Halieaceae bacterium]|jgi:23S rRNA pseudouridine2457 synthase|nr:pseudouridine synthase [Halieaceae bacterium]
MATIILLNKPFRVLSQFTDARGRSTLADHLRDPGFYPAGRLDYDSEGLLLLCDDGSLQARISSPKYGCWKSYLVQVEGKPDDCALEVLRSGVVLKDGRCLPARARRVDEPRLWERRPAVEPRAASVSTWLEIAIREGRNRQVRRMCAAIGFPVLRLVRTAVGDWTLGALQPGESRRESVHLPSKKARRSGSGKIRG